MIKLIEKSGAIKGRQAAGIELQLTGNSHIIANVAILKKMGSNISLKKSFRRLTSYESIKEFVPASIPFSLTIDGKGVIYKKVAIEPGTSLLNHLLPNAPEKDFYVFQYPSADDKVYLAAIRKELLNEILSEFQKLGIAIVHIDLGPFAVNNILYSLEFQNDLRVSNYRITGDKLINQVENQLEFYTGLNYKLGNEYIDSLSLIPFATGVNYFIKNSGTIEFDESRHKYEEFLFGRLIKTLSLAFFGFLLIGLMINFHFFNQFYTRHNQLSFQLAQKKDLVSKLDTLKNELQLKEQYVVKRGYLNASKLSFYADRIAGSVPSSVILNRLGINPVMDKIKTGEEIEIQKDAIIIYGDSQKNMVLNAWMRDLKNRKWVHSVRLVSYKKDQPEDAGEFTIKITL